jgi:hypothetical protein
VDGVELERTKQVLEFVDEELGRPEVGRRIREMRAVAASELVVVDDRAAGLVGEQPDVAHVVVSHAGPAVQHDEGQGSLAGDIRFFDAHPCGVAAERNEAGGHN